jgi:YbgC/YbaW family acyl-CoA thioester hydrolase
VTDGPDRDGSGPEPFIHRITVRYGEVDMQRVVFNAHYLAYCDDAIDTWFRTALGAGGGMDQMGFDFMVKSVNLTWHRPLVFGEVADLDCSISRWGSSSFDVRVEATCTGDERFAATLTYVSVVPKENVPTPVPERVRALLDA